MICPVCERTFTNEQVSGRSRCSGCNTKIRRYRTKKMLVYLHGNECARCGWTGPIAAFQFHHRDPSTKEFSIGNVANKKWEIVLKEAEKCDMLCANCHAIEHSNHHPKLIEAVKNYNGRVLVAETD